MLRIVRTRGALAAPVLGACWLCLGLAGASAAPISYDPAPMTSSGLSACANYGGFACLTSAFFAALSLDAGKSASSASLLLDASVAWNAIKTANGGVVNTWAVRPSDDPVGSLGLVPATGAPPPTPGTAQSNAAAGPLLTRIDLDSLALPVPEDLPSLRSVVPAPKPAPEPAAPK